METFVSQKLHDDGNTEQFLVRYEVIHHDVTRDGVPDTIVMYVMSSANDTFSQHTVIWANYGPVHVSYIRRYLLRCH